MSNKQTAKTQPQHHEKVLSRIISSPRSRAAANTYIYRAPMKEKQVLTRMLNEWNRDCYTNEATESVLRPEAVPIIKDWLVSARGHEVEIAKKLLCHLSKEKQKVDELECVQYGSPSIDGNDNDNNRASTSHEKDNETERSSTRSSNHSRAAGKQSRASTRANVKKSQPNFGNPGPTLTNGTYYPNRYEGFGNNTAFFNIVRGPPRLKTAPEIGRNRQSAQSQNSERSTRSQRGQQSAYSQKSQQSRRPTMMYNNINRSRVVGRYETAQTRPATTQGKLESRVSTQMSRPKTRNNQPNTQNSRINTGLSRKSSAEKIKFSANLQNTAIEEIEELPASTSPRQKAPSVYEGGDETYRDIGLGSHWPGRQYYPTQFLLN